MSKINIPAPTGKYKVGTSLFTIVTYRVETLGPNAWKENRKVTARIYYPADESDVVGKPRANVISPDLIKPLAKAFSAPYKVFAENNEADFYLDVLPAAGEKFPLVVFNHGYQSYIESNNLMCIDLCSHGYVVLSVGHTFEAAVTDLGFGQYALQDKTAIKKMLSWGYIKGALKLQKMKVSAEEREKAFREWQDKCVPFFGERLVQWQDDVVCAIDECKERFADRIDFENIGMTGHSFGGNTAYYMCHNMPEIKCGINLDGGIFGNYDGLIMHKPILQITSGPNKNIMAKVELDKDAPLYMALIDKVRHIGLSDAVWFIPSKMVVGKVPADILHRFLCEAHLRFFDRYLKGKDVQMDLKGYEDYIEFKVL